MDKLTARKILGIEADNPTDKEIKEAYLLQVRINHPDRLHNADKRVRAHAENQMKLINEALEILEGKRKVSRQTQAARAEQERRAEERRAQAEQERKEAEKRAQDERRKAEQARKEQREAEERRKQEYAEQQRKATENQEKQQAETQQGVNSGVSSEKGIFGKESLSDILERITISVLVGILLGFFALTCSALFIWLVSAFAADLLGVDFVSLFAPLSLVAFLFGIVVCILVTIKVWRATERTKRYRK